MMDLKRHAPVGRARRTRPRHRPHDLPQLYATRKRRPVPDLYVADRAEARRGGSFRWFFSTCLAASVGAIAIAAVVLGSMDLRDGHGGILSELRRDDRIRQTPRSTTAVPVDGQKWALPKVDRLQTAKGMISARYIVQESINEERGGLAYMNKKPYAKVVIRLGAVAPDPKRALPQFNPQNLFGGPEGEGPDRETGATSGEVTSRIVELLGAQLPSEDGQDIGAPEASELLRKSQDAQAPEPSIRPAFVPEGAQIALPKIESRAKHPRAQPMPPNTSVLEKLSPEIEEPTTGEAETAISSSLFASLHYGAYGHDISLETLQQVVRVHAHEIDFRRRASMADIAEFFFELKDEEKAAESPPGELLYTAMIVGGQTMRFFRFRTPDGIVDFYDENGSSSRKFLMRQPIRSDEVRLVSGFGMRFHPLLNQRKLHTGVDWAAPTGTPIMAAGNGVIEEAQYKGQYGNYIRIRHANSYLTAYGHMSRFAGGIAPGQKVRQGQIIGYVGSTGLSTGPHVHFEVLIGDRFVDPVKIPMPDGRRLAGRQLADFMREKGRIEDLMGRPYVKTVQIDGR